MGFVNQSDVTAVVDSGDEFFGIEVIDSLNVVRVVTINDLSQCGQTIQVDGHLIAIA